METFLTESAFYLIAAGFLHLLAALLIAPIFLLIARRLSDASFPRLVRVYLVFHAFLLFWGCLGHYLFHFLTFGKLYVSADRVVDWLPFIPFGQWVLDRTLGTLHGNLIGDATLWQLQLIWFTIATPVWLLAYVCTAKVSSSRPPRHASIIHVNRSG